MHAELSRAHMTGRFLQSLEELVARGDFVVPPYPAAALKLRRLVESGSFGLAEVADAASSDPALAAALLRIANSPLYRGSGAAITSLGRAVHRLGARTVATMALTAGVGAAACADGPLIDVKYRAWRRSLTCALGCQWLARTRALDPDEAFLAGVLHGFGRSVALGCLELLLSKSPAAERRSLQEWLQAIEPHRKLLTQKVAEAWQLPAEIRSVLGADAAQNPPNPFAALVSIADELAAAIDRGSPGEQLGQVAGLSPAEKQALPEFCSGLPGSLEALLEMPEPQKGLRPSSGAVTKPETSFTSEVRSRTMDVTDLRNRRSPVPLRATGVAQDGLVLDCERPMQESCVARLALTLGERQIEGWFSISLCVAERGRFRVEAHSFAANRELRETLLELWTNSKR